MGSIESAGATRCYFCCTSNAVGFTFFPSFERGSLRCETSLFAFESNESSEVDCTAPRLVESASIYILMTISAYLRDESRLKRLRWKNSAFSFSPYSLLRLDTLKRNLRLLCRLQATSYTLPPSSHARLL